MAQELMCKICKMPLRKDEDFGTNADGSKNKEYCIHCLKNGVRKDQEPKKGGCCGSCGWKK